MIFESLKRGLTKTRSVFLDKIETLVTGYRKLDDEFYEELEEILIGADLGVQTSMHLVETLQEKARAARAEDPGQVIGLLKEEIREILGTEVRKITMNPDGLTVILVVGVNGAGKTTSIGKIAWNLKSEGKKVILAAADTFRAAAVDQLERWAARVGVDLISQKTGADPAAVAFDAVTAARARGADVLIVDTAGRLHTKSNLMEEVRKTKRVLEREIPGAPHEVLLVVDASTGQNALEQARLFNQATGITGIVLTKLDGTAKGGIVIPIADKLDIPVKLIGIGEGVDDLKEFDPRDFVDSLFAGEED